VSAREDVDESEKRRRQMGGKRSKKTEPNRKVLIIDDDQDFVEAFKRTLEARQYSVTVTGSRPQAQETMRGEDPDIIVLGTITPAGEAFHIHEWLKGHGVQ
jgi:DNA-binding response OmpR family regulator